MATIAFGMGIDKTNIRYVVHMSLPKTMENFYQEIRRAGRDGLASESLLLYSKSDEIVHHSRLESIENEKYKEVLTNNLIKIYQFAISSKCRHQAIARYFDDKIKSCKSRCDNCKNHLKIK